MSELKDAALTPIEWLIRLSIESVVETDAECGLDGIQVGNFTLGDLLSKAAEYEKLYEAMQRDYVRLKVLEARVMKSKSQIK